MELDYERFLLMKSRATKNPIKATLELSPLCNMHCKMCYVCEMNSELSRPIMTADYWISLIPELKELGTLFVTLIGGEPFLYPGIETIYKALLENGFFVSFTTNGTLLADRIPDWLVENKPKYMTVSLNGASDETYAKVTGNPKGFTQASKALQNLLTAGIMVQINYCCLPENIGDLEKILLLGKKCGCRVIASPYSYPNNSRKEKERTERLSSAQAAWAYWKIQEINDYKRFQEKLGYVAGGAYTRWDPEIMKRIDCNAGISQMWINWKGQMGGCGIISAEGQQIFADTLQSEWKKVVEDYGSIVLSQDCAECEKRDICSVCPAMMVTETGSFGGKPEYVCAITNEVIVRARELLKTV